MARISRTGRCPVDGLIVGVGPSGHAGARDLARMLIGFAGLGCAGYSQSEAAAKARDDVVIDMERLSVI